MTAAWPASLPLRVDRHPYQEVPQPATVLFRPEVGPPIGRRRSTVRLSIVPFAFVMTTAQVATFETFVAGDLAGGVLPFTIRHPRTDATVTATLIDETPYGIAWFSPEAWTVTFRALVRG